MKVASSYSVFGPGKKREFGLFASVAVSPKGLLAGQPAENGAGGGWSAPGTAGRALLHGARESSGRGGGSTCLDRVSASRTRAETGLSARILRGEMGRWI